MRVGKGKRRILSLFSCFRVMFDGDGDGSVKGKGTGKEILVWAVR